MTPLEKREQLIRMFGAYSVRLEQIFDDYYNRLARIGLTEEVLPLLADDSALFSFSRVPEVKSQLDNIFDDFVNRQMGLYRTGITDGAMLAIEHDSSLLGGYSVLSETALKTIRNNAVQGFLRGRLTSSRGLSLSQLVWNYASQAKSEFEVAITNVITQGLQEGTSAEELGRKVREQLNNPDMMYRRYHEKVVMADGSRKDVAIWRRRVIDEDGKVRFVKEPLEKVGMGHYRSARKNALRLMRTEINASYHNANYERWQQEPFVIGIRIFLSPQHPEEDECDVLAGNYPKDFYWTGWHPQCYSDDTKVLTDAGWKLFADVSDNDRILSLNPETRAIEYVGIKDQQKWWKEGTMIHFSNRALDCLVTPEHRMVYLGKINGDIKYCSAEEYTQGKGAFYRGCDYAANDVASILIGEKHYDFDTFCEFMGYYLSDGSLIRTRQIVISQQDGQPHKEDIIECIKRMGFDVTTSRDFVNFYDTAFCSYLHQFGTSNAKFIPGEIKNASSRQIGIFLDAFARCDGHIKKPRSFVGNHGNVCVPKRGERYFYTTSKRMAGNLCELLLKIGHRPSIREQEPSVTVKKDGSVIKGNHICFVISDCASTTATAFKKETVDYSGYVYDLTLERNHIMYVQRNGRCFWGSNCMCAEAPITLQGDEKKAYYRRVALGEDMSGYVSPNAVTDVPDSYKEWIAANAERIQRADDRGKLAWHLEDNREYWEGIVKNVMRTSVVNTSSDNASKSARETDYNRYLADPKYKSVEYDAETGALKATHEDHKKRVKGEKYFKELDPNKEGFTGSQLEEECQKELYRMGNKAVLLAEGQLNKKGEEIAALDLDLNDNIMDIKSLTGGSVYNAISEKEKQIKKVYNQTGKLSDNLCIFIYNPEDYSIGDIRAGAGEYARRKKNCNQRQWIKHVYVVIRGAENYVRIDI